MELEPFAPQGQAPGFKISPDCGSLCQGGVYVEALCQKLIPPLIGFASCLPNIQSDSSALRLFEEEILSYVVVDSSYHGKRWIQDLPACHHEPRSPRAD